MSIIISYYNKKYQPKLIIQTRESDKKPQIRAILGQFDLPFGQEILFSKIGLRHFLRWFIEKIKINE